tara:strand:+ start:193 stop:528 length:336 start_codon:yes stop_codon:yes gene_type:complete
MNTIYKVITSEIDGCDYPTAGRQTIWYKNKADATRHTKRFNRHYNKLKAIESKFHSTPESYGLDAPESLTALRQKFFEEYDCLPDGEAVFEVHHYLSTQDSVVNLLNKHTG